MKLKQLKRKRKAGISDLNNNAGMGWNSVLNYRKTFVLVLLPLVLVLILFQCSKQFNVTDYGIFAPSRLAYVKGQDGCTPIDFNESTTIWTFGDTITDDGMLSNSLAFTEKIDESKIKNISFRFYTENGRVVEFIKYHENENPVKERLWPFDGIRIGNKVYVYYVHVAIEDPSKPLSFTIKESSIAYWDVPKQWDSGKRIAFVRSKNISREGIAFGASVLEMDEYLYVVGHGSKDNRSYLIIARVNKNEIMQFTKYEFLQGDSNWGKDIQKTKTLFEDVAGECSLHYDNNLSSFVLVYCQLFTGNIILCMAKSIEALPQAKKIIVYTPPKNDGTSMMYYSAKTIAQLKRNVFIVYMNPLTYQPYLISVDLSNKLW